MAESSEKVNFPLFANPLETFPGLTIDDLNKYLIPFDTLDLTKETRNDIVLRYFSDFKDQKSSSRIIEYLENNLVN